MVSTFSYASGNDIKSNGKNKSSSNSINMYFRKSQLVERDIHLSHLLETHIYDEMIASGKWHIDVFARARSASFRFFSRVYCIS